MLVRFSAGSVNARAKDLCFTSPEVKQLQKGHCLTLKKYFEASHFGLRCLRRLLCGVCKGGGSGTDREIQPKRTRVQTKP